MRILFLDDEPLALEALRRSLRSMRMEWQMAFADNGEAALRMMAEETFEMVVSDLLMPGMSGMQFLGEVRRRYPGTLRLVLSGYSDRHALVECAALVHQIIAKPCQADELRRAIQAAFVLVNGIEQKPLREVVCQAGWLPTPRVIREETWRVLSGLETSHEELATVVSRDIGLAAMVLKLANSGVFNVRRQISSIRDAICCLGTEVVRDLILSAGTIDQAVPQPIERLMEKLWRHSLDTAMGAKTIARIEESDAKLLDEAFAAGLLHDAGKFLLVSHFPQPYSAAVRLAVDEKLELSEAERRIFGCSHAELGAALLGLWGFPQTMLQAVSLHHFPSRDASDSFTSLTAVHVANTLVHESDGMIGAGNRARCDSHHLNGLGLGERMCTWRGAVREILAVEKLCNERGGQLPV